jgi:transcriptional regulator with XRE-family HTH domain
MSRPNQQPIVPSNWEFDATGFASAVADARLARGWSTRELSRRAGISQPYVVALERAREGGADRTPTPAIDVVARLADALGLRIDQLVGSALRRSPRHVLLVLDADHRHPMSHVREFTRDDPDAWVWASSASGDTPRAASHRIDLRRDSEGAYRPDHITRSLQRELRALAPELGNRTIGLVLPETSSVMASIDDPGTVLGFEARWGDIVARAAESVGAHAAWNVCVYEVGALRGLHDPVEATLGLIADHDAVWSAGRTRSATGPDAAEHILERLRPAGTDSGEWTTHVRQLVHSLRLAA